jgi:hypothetical protein
MKAAIFYCLFLALFLCSCQKEQIENKPPSVNAGNDVTVQLKNATDSLQLTGTAADADGSVVAYLWSQISGPTTAIIHNNGSSTTYISGFVSGVYVFQLMATDDKGATGVKSVIITIKGLEVFTLTLQPAQNPYDLHFQLVGNTSNSDPTAPEIGAAAWTINSVPAYVRGLVKFDLSTLPANAIITSARLSLYSNPTPLNGNLVDANYGIDNTLLLQRVTSNWNTSFTWQTQPSTDAATQIVIPHTSQSMLDITDLDVTSQMKAMQQFGNYGFMIRLQNEVIYTSRIFCSSKHAIVSKHPKLVILYTKQ